MAAEQIVIGGVVKDGVVVPEGNTNLPEGAHVDIVLSTVDEDRKQQDREERLRLAEELLTEVEDIEDDSQGFDTAERIRRMRDERIAQICQKDV